MHIFSLRSYPRKLARLASGSDRTSADRHHLIALRFPYHRSACWCQDLIISPTTRQAPQGHDSRYAKGFRNRYRHSQGSSDLRKLMICVHGTSGRLDRSSFGTLVAASPTIYKSLTIARQRTRSLASSSRLLPFDRIIASLAGSSI